MTSSVSRFLSPSVVVERTSLSRTTIWRMVRDGKFPPAIPLSPGRVAWSEQELGQWMADRAQGRNAAQLASFAA